jgi:regulator of sigma E protease
MLVNAIHLAEGAVVFLLMLMVLVAAHELGHYLFARMFHMGVEEFSIGMFGKRPLVTWLRRTYRIRLKPSDDPYKRSAITGMGFEGGATEPPSDPVVIDGPSGRELEETTVFTIRPVPLGGFVRIKGMMPEEDGSEVLIPGGFYSRPAWQRFLTLLAGPVFSILAGVIVMIPVYACFGEMRASNVPILGAIYQGSPAEKAGLKEGDRIVSIDGRPIQTFYQIIVNVRDSAGVPLKFVYERSKKLGQTTVVPVLAGTPQLVKGPDLEPTGEIRSDQALMGVRESLRLEKLPLGKAVVTALDLPIANVQAILSMLHEPAVAKVAVTGPAGMLTATADAVQGGFVDVVATAAFISIALGIFNLFPIYPLDGGQMAVAIAEMLRGGRRLSLRVQTMVGTIGLGLVLLIFVGVCTIDIGRIAGKGPTEPFSPPAQTNVKPKR